MLTDIELLSQSEDDYMCSAQLDFFKARLQTKVEDLRGRLTSNRLGCGIERHADVADFASDEEQRSFALQMIERDKIALNQVLNAIELIRLGDYGYCKETGEPIGLHRLLLVPESIYSVESMRVAEAAGRHQRAVF